MVSMRHRGRSAALAGILVLAAAGYASAAGTLQAELDRKVVQHGDTVRLTLRYGGDEQPQRPDLGPLAADFEILGTEQSQSISVVNGRAQATRELDVVLSPKRSGAITIPALQAGDVATEPLTLTVLDASASNAPSSQGAGAAEPSAARDGDAPDLFVEATADETTPFVQGEVHYTVRVYDGIGIREGALTEPEAKGVRVEPIGDTRTYQQLLHGRRYVVHEREYALFPQSSGELTVPPVVLQARVPEEPQRGRGGRHSPFDDAVGEDVFAEMFAQMRAGGFGGSLIDRVMNPGREVRVRSNPVTLAVQGRPADAASGWFLPARAVELSQSWQPARPTFRVDETVRRTVTLRAEGASSQQLPKLEVAEVAGVKQYTGAAEQRSVPTASGVAAELVQTFDLLPAQAGSFTLPQIEVQWWDVAAKTQRTATLPAETIEVLAAPGAEPARAGAQPAQSQAAAAVRAMTSAAPDAAQSGSPAAAAPTTTSAADTAPAAQPSLDLSSGLVAGGILAALLLAAAIWRTSRRRSGSQPAPDAARTAPRVPARALVDALHQACTANDARAVRDALLAWARVAWADAPPTSVSTIARRLTHAGFTESVKMLDDSLYAPRATAFDGARLWREFTTARKTAGGGTAASAELLPALYPDSRVA